MLIKITDDLMRELSGKALASTRKRTNYNFHKSPQDTVQRMLNAAEPGTYIRPHKHEDPDKTEVFVILRGRVVIVEFDENGGITDHVVLDRKKGACAVEIPPKVWHTFITLEPGSVLYEVKEGPYDKNNDKNFASWAPGEGEKGASEFNGNILRSLKIGNQ